MRGFDLITKFLFLTLIMQILRAQGNESKAVADVKQREAVDDGLAFDLLTDSALFSAPDATTLNQLNSKDYSDNANLQDEALEMTPSERAHLNSVVKDLKSMQNKHQKRLRRRKLQASCPLNLVLVVDASGTMTEAGKWNTAKSAILRMTGSLDVNLVYVVKYGPYAQVVVGPTAHSAGVDSTLAGSTAIGGGTFLHRGLNLALSQVGTFLGSSIPTKFAVISDFLLDDRSQSNSVMSSIKAQTGWQPWCIYVGPNNDPSKPNPITVAREQCAENVLVYPSVTAFYNDASNAASQIAGCSDSPTSTPTLAATDAPTSREPTATPTSMPTMQGTSTPSVAPTTSPKECQGTVKFWPFQEVRECDIPFVWWPFARQKKRTVTGAQLAQLYKEGKITQEELESSLGREQAAAVINLVATEEQQAVYHRENTVAVLEAYVHDIRAYINTAVSANVLNNSVRFTSRLDNQSIKIKPLKQALDPVEVKAKSGDILQELGNIVRDVAAEIEREIQRPPTAAEANHKGAGNIEIGRTKTSKSYTKYVEYFGLWGAGLVSHERPDDTSNVVETSARPPVVRKTAPPKPSAERTLPEWPPKPEGEEYNLIRAEGDVFWGIPTLIGAILHRKTGDLGRLPGRVTEIPATGVVHNPVTTRFRSWMGWPEVHNPTDNMVRVLQAFDASQDNIANREESSSVQKILARGADLIKKIKGGVTVGDTASPTTLSSVDDPEDPESGAGSLPNTPETVGLPSKEVSTNFPQSDASKSLIWLRESQQVKASTSPSAFSSKGTKTSQSPGEELQKALADRRNKKGNN